MNAFSSYSIVLFRLINFSIVVGIFWYLFNKYLRQSIKAQIKAQEAEFTQLKEKNSHLIQEEKQIKQAIADDREECKRLKEKVIWWRQAVMQQEEARRQEKYDRVAHLEQVMKQQMIGIAQQQAFQEAAPLVVDKLHQELHEAFQETKRLTAFQKSIISQLEQA